MHNMDKEFDWADLDSDEDLFGIGFKLDRSGIEDAVGIEDLFLGVRLTCYRAHLDQSYDVVVISEPFSSGSISSSLKIKLISSEYFALYSVEDILAGKVKPNHIHEAYLGDLGIVPYRSGAWNDGNYVKKAQN